MLKTIVNKLHIFYYNSFYNNINIHKKAFIDFRVEIYKKSNIKIGFKSILYKYITLYKSKKGSFIMGSHSHIAPYCYFLLQDNTIKIGNNVAIAKNCSFFCISNSIPNNSKTLFKDSYFLGDIEIGNNVFIGTNCVILPNTIIEDNIVIGANSTIKGKLENGYLYGGNPVKKIKKVFNE